MFYIPKHQMKIGQKPDYSMRIGKMEIYHKANIYFFSRNRKFLASALKSDRSLHTVAVATREVLKNPSFSRVDTNRRLANARSRVLNTGSGLIMIRLRLPVTLDKNKFNEICKHFWEVIFPEEQKAK